MPKKNINTSSDGGVAAVLPPRTVRVRKAKPLPASRARAIEWATQLFNALRTFRTMNRLEQKACRSLMYEVAANADGQPRSGRDELPEKLLALYDGEDHVAMRVGDAVSEALDLAKPTRAELAAVFPILTPKP